MQGKASVTKDIKIFKLKARGAAGSCKTELLIAFGRIVRSFGMITALSADGHDMLITSSKEQRCALYEFNRKGSAHAFAEMGSES
jgi:hypothetical protein